MTGLPAASPMEPEKTPEEKPAEASFKAGWRSPSTPQYSTKPAYQAPVYSNRPAWQAKQAGQITTANWPVSHDQNNDGQFDYTVAIINNPNPSNRLNLREEKKSRPLFYRF